MSNPSFRHSFPDFRLFHTNTNTLSPLKDDNVTSKEHSISTDESIHSNTRISVPHISRFQPELPLPTTSINLAPISTLDNPPIRRLSLPPPNSFSVTNQSPMGSSPSSLPCLNCQQLDHNLHKLIATNQLLLQEKESVKIQNGILWKMLNQEMDKVIQLQAIVTRQQKEIEEQKCVRQTSDLHHLARNSQGDFAKLIPERNMSGRSYEDLEIIIHSDEESSEYESNDEGQYQKKRKLEEGSESTPERHRKVGSEDHTNKGIRIKQWNQHFEELVEFKKKHGHTIVPESQKSLYKWCTNQRGYFRHNKLDPEKISKLHEIGFMWNIDSKQEKYLIQIKAFYQQYGHCNVPEDTDENKKLVKWMRSQKRRKESGSLNDRVYRELDQMGFKWWTTPLNSSTEKPPTETSYTTSTTQSDLNQS